MFKVLAVVSGVLSASSAVVAGVLKWSKMGAPVHPDAPRTILIVAGGLLLSMWACNMLDNRKRPHQ